MVSPTRSFDSLPYALTFYRQFFGLSLGVTVLFVVYTLYWNRLLASVICFGLRLMTWDANTPGSFWIEAGELRNGVWDPIYVLISSTESAYISLLFGRIMLRDVKYYSANQTIRAVKCYVTWRYWLWRTRSRDENEPDGPEEGTRMCPVCLSLVVASD